MLLTHCSFGAVSQGSSHVPVHWREATKGYLAGRRPWHRYATACTAILLALVWPLSSSTSPPILTAVTCESCKYLPQCLNSAGPHDENTYLPSAVGYPCLPADLQGNEALD